MNPVWASALLNAAVRRSGNMQLPAILMIVSSILQVPIAGLLILGTGDSAGLGLPGASVAVIITSAVNAVILGIYLWRRTSSPRLRLDALRLEGRYFSAIFQVGLVASLSPLFVVLTVTLINVLVGRFGMEALAGYGIVARLEFLLVPLVFGFGAAMVSLVGTNVGAKQLERAERIGWIGGSCAATATGVVGLTLARFPALWLTLFAILGELPWQTGETYLQIVGPAFLFRGLGLSLYFASQGTGAVKWPVIASFEDLEAASEHQPDMPVVPAVDDVISQRQDRGAERFPFPYTVGTSVEVEVLDGWNSRDSTSSDQPIQLWIRGALATTGDARIQQCALVYLSDNTLLFNGMRRHGSVMTGYRITSLDHALWFHRVLDCSQWMFYDQQGPSAADGRTMNHGRIWSADGVLLATAAREGMLRKV